MASGSTSIDTLIVLGSGMSGCFAPEEIELLADEFSTTVEGHPGRLALYRREKRTQLLSFGRKHFYEGSTVEEVLQLYGDVPGVLPALSDIAPEDRALYYRYYRRQGTFEKLRVQPYVKRSR